MPGCSFAAAAFASASAVILAHSAKNSAEPSGFFLRIDAGLLMVARTEMCRAFGASPAAKRLRVRRTIPESRLLRSQSRWALDKSVCQDSDRRTGNLYACYERRSDGGLSTGSLLGCPVALRSSIETSSKGRQSDPSRQGEPTNIPHANVGSRSITCRNELPLKTAESDPERAFSRYDLKVRDGWELPLKLVLERTLGTPRWSTFRDSPVMKAEASEHRKPELPSEEWF